MPPPQSPPIENCIDDYCAVTVFRFALIYKTLFSEADINFLLKVALERIAFLPYAYVMDKWMWHVYSGEIETSEMNEKWWNYRQKYQGLKPPIARTEDDFDPGAKYHIPGDTPYIR